MVCMALYEGELHGYILFICRKLDIIILNAGVFGLRYSVTEDNYESTFQVNHLSHLYLALLLEPLLDAGSRVIFVSSESHRFNLLSLDFVMSGS